MNEPQASAEPTVPVATPEPIAAPVVAVAPVAAPEAPLSLEPSNLAELDAFMNTFKGAMDSEPLPPEVIQRLSQATEDDFEPAPEVTPTPAPTAAEVKDVPPVVTQPPAAEEVPGKGTQFRLRANDPVKEKAYQHQRANPEASLEESTAWAREQLGVPPVAPAVQPQTQPVQPVEQLSPDEIERQAIALESQADDAFGLYDNATALSLRAQARELRLQAINNASASKVNQQASAAYASASQRATALYPEAADPNSEFHQRMEEIDQAFAETNDPRFDDTNKPLLIAQIVAAELGRVPQTPNGRPKAAPVVAAPTAPVPPPIPAAGSPSYPVAPIAGGNARTSTDVGAQLFRDIEAINSPDALDAFRRKLILGA